MIGASRESVARVQLMLASRQGDLSALSADLLAVASVVAAEPALQQTLADGGQPVAARQALVNQLLAGKVSAAAVEVVSEVVAERWSSPADLVTAIETLGAQAAFLGAGKGLTDVEDEIFHFGRLVAGSPALQMALTDPAAPSTAKSALVADLLSGKASATSVAVLAHAAANLRGRRLGAVIDDLLALAAAQRGLVVAQVRSAVSLTEAQVKRLGAALSTITGKQVRVNVAVDPSVVGGISVNVDGQIIDGTVASRLEHARRALLA
jgi:F-type H+-transporting ATPase subunit delta